MSKKDFPIQEFDVQLKEVKISANDVILFFSDDQELVELLQAMQDSITQIRNHLSARQTQAKEDFKSLLHQKRLERCLKENFLE